MLEGCATESSSTCPDSLKELVTDTSIKAVSNEVFMQLYKLLDLVGSLSSVLVVVQKDSMEVESLKELIDGLSLFVPGVKTSIGKCPITSALEPDLWAALTKLEGKIEVLQHSSGYQAYPAILIHSPRTSISTFPLSAHHIS